MDSKIKKADDKLQKLASTKRKKGIEDRQVSSEVFDKKTLETLYKFANQRYIDVLNGAISTGKEANVFKGIKEDGDVIAVKVYRIATSDFRKMQYYMQGDPRFNIKTTNKRKIIYNWTYKEFRNLKRAKDNGVNVPEPIVANNNVLLMEFIGDKKFNPAPTLKNKKPKDVNEFLDKLLSNLRIFIKDANLVHGDLSSFNILNKNEEPVIIDVSQSVVRNNPIAHELLERDINTIYNDFKKLGADVSIEYIKKTILK